MSNSDDIHHLIAQLQSLRLTHLRETQQLCAAHHGSEQQLLTQIATTAAPQAPPSTSFSSFSSSFTHHRDCSGDFLSVGDKVRLLTTAKSGKIGDIAIVTGLTKRVKIRLLLTKTTTHRISPNLTLLHSSDV